MTRNKLNENAIRRRLSNHTAKHNNKQKIKKANFYYLKTLNISIKLLILDLIKC